ncbi:MAG: PadR family transcriptional regulator [Oscillospiraceae bacterium]
MESVALTEAVYYILLSLDTPRHGYGIMQNTERLSGGRVRLAAGTLYGALSTLLEKGWIRAAEEGGGARKKEYEITEAGRQAVEREILRLRELLKNGEAVTKEWGA